MVSQPPEVVVVAALGTILKAGDHVSFYSGGRRSDCGCIWRPGISNRKSAACRNVLTCWHVVVLTDSWGWVCQTCWSALERLPMSLGWGSHYGGGLAQPTWSKEGKLLLESTCFATRPAAGSRWKKKKKKILTCATSSRRNPSQPSNRVRTCKNSRADPKEPSASLWNEE